MNDANNNRQSDLNISDESDLAMDKSGSLQDIFMAPDVRSSTETDDEKKAETNETKTTTAATGEEQAPETEDIPELESPELSVGDHVYQWRSLCGVPFMFQHHGIVMDIIEDKEGKPVRLTIADFAPVQTKPSKKKSRSKSKTKKDAEKDSTQNPEETMQQIAPPALAETDDATITTTPATESFVRSSSLSSSGLSSMQPALEQKGILHTYTDTDKWHKVRYQMGWWTRQMRRSGTVTKAKSDPVGLVLARVNFIMQHTEMLPDYHVLHANCECVAFWCKTGSWATLQASSFLELTAAGQVKSTATIAATAASSTATVTVPAAGIWGSWFGFTSTSTVSWLSLHPMAIPGLACYAAVTVGVPAVMYATAHKKWTETTQRLNDAFWESATAHPDIFAECITHWSEKG